MSRELRRNLDMKAQGKPIPEMTKPPRKNVSRQISHPPRKAFDYRVIMQDGIAYFVVDGNIPSDKAARLFHRYRPMADALENYGTSWCRFNVSIRDYELCNAMPGSFPVHTFMMEE